MQRFTCLKKARFLLISMNVFAPEGVVAVVPVT